MDCKEMKVWSSGSKNAKTLKICFVGYIICFIVLCCLQITAFTSNIHDDKSIQTTLVEHLLFGFVILIITGWISAGLLFMIKDSLHDIKENKLITLYLYEIDEFVKIGEIPDDKFVLFSDRTGAVLADKKYEKESTCFAFGVNYFYEFKNYCEKMNKMEEIKSE